jgi:hypothetical protein
VAEQFTRFNTYQFDGREVPNIETILPYHIRAENDRQHDRPVAVPQTTAVKKSA